MNILKKEIKEINNQLYYNNQNLINLVNRHGTPLRISFLDVIKNHIIELKESFDKVIKELDYHGKFVYVNANKANYEFLEVDEAYKYSDGIETSSFNDLLLTKDIVSLHDEKYKKPIICNGIKGIDYLSLIIDMTKEGFNIINILDSLDEYKLLKSLTNDLVKIGVRIHLTSLYHEENDIITDDRFGMSEREFDAIINDLTNNKCKFILTTIHFHQRGFDFEKDKFLENIDKAFKYYINAKKKLNTITCLDIGGGTPLPINDTFDYNNYATILISALKEKAKQYNVDEPNIISENGKYSQKDSTINIYKVVSVKNTDSSSNIPWYVLDGSMMIALPEGYLGEEFLVLPINNLDSPFTKARLSSITCDCDDILYDKKLGYSLLPKNTKDLYIAFFGTGSYQNSMNGKGGWHHCLLPQEKDVVIYTKNNNTYEVVRGELQTIEEIKKLVHFPTKH